MEARISAVRHALWLLLVAAALCAAATLPQPENRTTMRALRELSAASGSFRREEAEAKLLAQARMQGAQPLRAILPPRTRRLPSVSVLDDALPVAPLSAVALDSLAALRAFAEGVEPAQKTLVIGVPELGHVASALGWRLARRPPGTKVVLSGARLVPAQVDERDVAREAEVAELALVSEQAERALRDAEKKLAQADAIVEARLKRRMPWKAIVKARESKAEAQALFDTQSAAAGARKAAYEAAVAAATAPRAALEVPPMPSHALLRVTLQIDGASQLEQVDVPVAVHTRSVPVSALAGAAFPALAAAGLWDAVKGGNLAAARAVVEARFNWHMRPVAWLGNAVQGAFVLQLVPCVLPLLLLWLLGRIHALAVSYSPFTTEVRASLPRPGFAQRWLEFVTVLAMPLIACGTAAASLVAIDRTPALPALSAGLCFFLGVRAYGKLADLGELVDSVVQSHSYPPAH
jgi:hypothetical protein